MSESESYYHATGIDHGRQFEFDEGGQYEKIFDDGEPRKNYMGGGFVGWFQSDVPEFVASASKAGALYGELSSLTKPIEKGRVVHLYRIERQPDHDLRGCTVGDFAISEEVRYRKPAENPVPGTRVQTVQVPGRACRDVVESSTGWGDVDRDWARAVRSELKALINGADYPSSLSEKLGRQPPEEPDPDRA